MTRLLVNLVVRGVLWPDKMAANVPMGVMHEGQGYTSILTPHILLYTLAGRAAASAPYAHCAICADAALAMISIPPAPSTAILSW
jgi:hypothetical protein